MRLVVVRLIIIINMNNNNNNNKMWFVMVPLAPCYHANCSNVSPKHHINISNNKIVLFIVITIFSTTIKFNKGSLEKVSTSVFCTVNTVRSKTGWSVTWQALPNTTIKISISLHIIYKIKTTSTTQMAKVTNTQRSFTPSSDHISGCRNTSPRKLSG